MPNTTPLQGLTGYPNSLSSDSTFAGNGELTYVNRSKDLNRIGSRRSARPLTPVDGRRQIQSFGARYSESRVPEQWHTDDAWSGGCDPCEGGICPEQPAVSVVKLPAYRAK